MKTKTMHSAGSLEDLVKFYNERMYSENWVAKDDNGILRLFNTKLNKFARGFIKITKSRAALMVEVQE